MSVSEDHKALLVWRAAQRNDYTWTASTVQAVGRLCATLIRPKLVEIWARGGLEDSVLLVLANEPHPDDGPLFVVGLRSTTLEVVEASAAALNKLEPQRDKADVFGAIIALRKLLNDRGSAATRDTLLALLKDRTGQSHNDAESWAGWFAKSHPDLAAVLNHPDGFDAAAWRKRETTIPWSEGDSVKGRAASIKATCAACHDGGGAIGPSLAGVSKRFSRDDLLTAILQPSKDVSPRYRPTRIITTDGKSYVGMIVYEAVSGIILQTGPDAVIRLSGDQIESQKLLDTSLMPTGLLDKLTDREVADLLTYLRSQ